MKSFTPLDRARHEPGAGRRLCGTRRNPRQTRGSPDPGGNPAGELYYTILYYTILYYTILYYTILCYTILYYTILYYTVLYCTMLYYTILYYTILYYAMLYYTMLCYAIIYYTILYYAILYYTILYYTIIYYNNPPGSCPRKRFRSDTFSGTLDSALGPELFAPRSRASGSAPPEAVHHRPFSAWLRLHRG